MPTPPSAPPPKRLQWSARTDRGKVRPNNEDAFIGLQFDAREVRLLGKVGEASLREADLAFAVSDGMGGAHAGEFASRIAVEKIAKLLPGSFKLSAAGFATGFEDMLTELYDQIHRALAFVGNSYEECQGMETTLSLAWFTPEWMYFAHIGDSRIYYLPAEGGGLRQLTEDDTHVGWLLRQGQINEREARHHPRRRVLQKSLGGSNQFVHPQVGAVGCEPGDIFLLCSDGLTEGLYDGQLAELLRASENPSSSANPAHLLVDESLQRDGRDNVTAVVVKVG
jgi:protein phosphatase